MDKSRTLVRKRKVSEREKSELQIKEIQDTSEQKRASRRSLPGKIKKKHERVSGNRHDGVVIRAYALQSVDLGFIT